MRMNKAVAAATVCIAAATGVWLGLGRLAAQNGTDPLKPKPVPILSGRRTGEEIAQENERLWGFKGEITGRVLLNDGNPAVGFPVVARFQEHQTGAQGEGEAVTDANGMYRIHGLNPQNFVVQVGNGGAPYIPAPSRVVAVRDAPGKIAANVNFTLHLGPQVTVRVRNAQTDKAVAGASVLVSPFPGTGGLPHGVTDANGEYRFRVGAMETPVHLEVGKQNGYSVSAAPGSSFYHSIHFRTFADLHDVFWDVKTYSDDPKLFHVVFRGRVTGQEGEPVEGAQILIARHGTTEQFRSRTDAEGWFSIPTYRMSIAEFGNWDGRNKMGILVEAEKNGQRTSHFATPEETWSTIPIRLTNENSASLTGTVVDPYGKPLVGVPIRCHESFPDVGAYTTRNGGVSGAGGRFTIDGLSPKATYSLSFGGWPQFGGSADFGESKLPAGKIYTPLHLDRNETRDVGRVVVWPADAVIVGRIETARGKFEANKNHVTIRITGSHTESYPSIGENGRFEAQHIVREPLMLYVFRVNEGFARTSPGSQDEVTHQSVHAGDEDVKIVLP